MDIALGLNEIRTLIGTYLDNNDIDSCRLVNKEWSHSFASLIWREIDVSNPRPIHPTLAVNAQHVQKLVLSEFTYPEFYIIPRLYNIKHLHIGFKKMNNRPYTAQTYIPRLIRDQHQFGTVKGLFSLHLRNVQITNSIQFWEMISNYCPNPNNLKLEGEVDKVIFLVMWQTVCSTRLKTLELTIGTPTSWTNPRTDLKTLQEQQKCEIVSNVQSLTLIAFRGMSRDGILTWMQLCPHLKEFFFSDWGPSGGYGFCTRLREGCWKGLDSFAGSLKGAVYPDRSIANVIQAMPTIRALRFEDSRFSTLALKALQDRVGGLENLQELSLKGCRFLMRDHVLTLLEEAPRLVKLRADKVEGSLLIKSRPWACALSLKHLDVHIELPWPPATKTAVENEEQWKVINRSVMEYLAALVNIEELHITTYGTPGHTAVIFGSEFGLDPLWRLKRLSSLGKRAFFVEWADLEWAFEHWPRWRGGSVWLKGPVDMTPERDMLLRNRGITLHQD